jgi:hypothetical protein
VPRSDGSTRLAAVGSASAPVSGWGMSSRLLRSALTPGLASCAEILPTMVTSMPSSTHTAPRPITIIQCHRDHGSRSSLACTLVVTVPVWTFTKIASLGGAGRTLLPARRTFMRTRAGSGVVCATADRVVAQFRRWRTPERCPARLEGNAQWLRQRWLRQWSSPGQVDPARRPFCWSLKPGWTGGASR